LGVGERLVGEDQAGDLLLRAVRVESVPRAKSLRELGADEPAAGPVMTTSCSDSTAGAARELLLWLGVTACGSQWRQTAFGEAAEKSKADKGARRKAHSALRLCIRRVSFRSA